MDSYVGYVRVSKNDGTQNLDLQKDALKKAGVDERMIYEDYASGKRDDRTGLEACLKALRSGDTLVVWKLDRLGRNLAHLSHIVNDLNALHVGLKVLDSSIGQIDTSTPSGKFMFHIFGVLAEYERDLIRERTMAGLKAARARGRCGGRPQKITEPLLKVLAMGMQHPTTKIVDLCKSYAISKSSLYKYLSPNGQFKSAAMRMLKMK